MLDFLRVIAGSSCATPLADMGGDIIKVDPGDEDAPHNASFVNGHSIYTMTLSTMNITSVIIVNEHSRKGIAPCEARQWCPTIRDGILLSTSSQLAVVTTI